MSTLELPMRLENPVYGLVGLVLGTFVAALFYLSHGRLRKAEKTLELVEWRNLRRIVRLMNIGTKTGAIIALSFLLATPYFPATIEVPVDQVTEEQMAQYRIVTMLVMDVSYSMNYSDLTPTRLEVAKNMAKLLVNKTNPEDLVGFVSFAGYVYDTVYPTKARTQVTEKIDNQTIHTSTAIGTALESAIGVLDSFPLGGRAIVLFSDGKNNVGDITSAVDDAISRKIPVFTVSVGTYGLGEADPVALREIAVKTGGKFYEVRNEEIERLATSVSEISHEVKVEALKAVYDRLVLHVKDYEAPTVVFSVLLVAALFLMWFTGV